MIYIKYQNQELGNLEFEYNYTVNMKNAVESMVTFSAETQTMPIYHKKKLMEADTKGMATQFFQSLGTEINEDETDLYEDTAIYKANGYSLWIDYKDGTYSYTDFSEFSHGEILPVKHGENRESIEKALKKFGIELPENAKFEEIEENHSPYTFTVDMEIHGDQLQNGNLQCSYYEDGTIKNITNRIITYNKAKEKEIISQESAYHEILNGHFLYSRALEKPENIMIKNVELQYALDSKGYYVPVYAFETEINSQETIIYIKAIKNS